jgi:DNA-binding transcriptional regulator GbsR (MarR family)
MGQEQFMRPQRSTFRIGDAACEHAFAIAECISCTRARGEFTSWDAAVKGNNAPADQFIERLGRLIESEGLPRTAGRMLGLLMISGEPLSIDDVAEELRVSRASVSTNGRLLESLDIAKRVTKPGDRRDYIQISDDPCSSLLSLGVRRLNDMRRAVREMRTAGSQVRAATPMRQRLERMEKFYDLAISKAESVLSAWKRERTGGRKHN